MKMDKVLETLKEDYALRASLKRKHLNVQDELEDEIEDLEQSLITSKIIPELEQHAKDLLKDLECEVYFAIKMDANGGVEVIDELSCSPTTFTKPQIQPKAKPQIQPKTQQPVSMSSSDDAILITPQNIHEVQGRDMRITVNGKVFQEKKSVQAFINALDYIGLDNVAKVGLDCAGYNLVDTRQRVAGGRKWQQKVRDKWVYVYMSNVAKSEKLMKISEFLKIDIKIEAI